MVPTIHAYGDLVGGSAFYRLIQQSSQNCAHVDGGIFTGLRIRRGIGAGWARRAATDLYLLFSTTIAGFFVTAQVFRSGSSQPEGLDQGVRVLSKGLEDIPALLFGGRDHGTVDDASIGPVFRPKAARDLLLDLHHASVLLRLVVGEGNVWIGQEA